MWFATLVGQQIPLGITDPDARPAAEEAYRRLVASLSDAVVRTVLPPGPRSVREAVTEFLAVAEQKLAAGRLTPNTVAGYRLALTPLVTAFGSRPVGTLTPTEIEEWADRPDWSASTRNTYLGTVQSLLRWCRVPLRLRRPPRESRGADTVLSDDQFARVLAEVRRHRGFPGDLGELLQVLRATGARPGEISGLTTESVDWSNACTRLRQHKTKRMTGRDRVIHFNTAAMAVLTAQREQYGSGLLFRTRAGGRYTPAAIVRRLGQVSRRVGFRVIAYGLGRHSFATRALAAGVPDAVVAELLGHRGTTMLHHHYQHLGDQARILKEAAEKVSARAG
jgi:integrase